MNSLFSFLDMIFTFPFQEECIINNTFSAKLTFFTHKRPRLNGPTKATASFQLIEKDKVITEIGLSIKGIQGKTQEEDGLSTKERYSFVVWKNYIFQLVDFKYNDFIKVEVIPYTLTFPTTIYKTKDNLILIDNNLYIENIYFSYTYPNGQADKAFVMIDILQAGRFVDKIELFENDTLEWGNYIFNVIDFQQEESITFTVHKK